MAGSIKKDIREGIKSKVYLVWGDEDYLKDYYSNALISGAVNKDFADFNYKQFTSGKINNDDIEGFLTSYPFMSDKKVIYIKDSGLFKKCSDSDKEFWKDLLSDLPDFALIVFSEKTVDKRNALYKLITASFCCDEFPIQKRSDLVSWISRYFNKFKKNITAEVADYMIDCCSENMYILKSEMDKMISFKIHSNIITKEDIDKCSCKIPESRVFKMIDDVLEGKIKEAGQKFAELKLLKEEPALLCAAIFSKYMQFKKIKTLSKTLSPREIAPKVKSTEYFVKLQLKQIGNLAEEKIDKVLLACETMDYKYKSGLSDAWTELEIVFAIMNEKSV